MHWQLALMKLDGVCSKAYGRSIGEKWALNVKGVESPKGLWVVRVGYPQLCVMTRLMHGTCIKAA